MTNCHSACKKLYLTLKNNQYKQIKIGVWCLLLIVVFTAFNTKNNYLFESELNCKPVLNLYSIDSNFVNPVYFCKDSIGTYFYYSNIYSTVCNDTLCRPIHLKVYWGLAGNYKKFDTVEGNPLTKNDHLLFKTADYNKLHSSLLNAYSILGERNKNELIDKNKTRYSEKIDGFSGATLEEIKSAVVDGALYSTYTLWHLVNDDVKDKIRENTLSNYNETVESQLLNSSRPRSIIFAFKNMNDKNYFEKFDQILNIMKSGNSLVNFYIAKSIPREVFLIEKNKEKLSVIFEQLDPNTKSILSEYLN